MPDHQRPEARDQRPGGWSDHIKPRLAGLRLSPAREMEIVEELSQHLEDRYREFVEGGASSEEATRLTLTAFKGEDILAKFMAPLRQAQDSPAPTPGAPAENILAALTHDLRYALRTLVKQPGFASTAILTLALGIGATTAIFSVVYGVLLKPLPFHEPDRLVALYHVTPAMPTDLQGDATYFTYREHGRVFEDIGLWVTGNVSVIRGETPADVQILRVTDGTLPLLGVRPVIGRLIDKEDDLPSSPLRVLLTHAYWQQTYGASTEVIGQSLVINGRPHEVIGVLPSSFKLLNTDPELVLPMRLNRAQAQLVALGMNGIGRLKPGVTIDQANDDVARMIPLLAEQFPLMEGLTQDVWDSIKLAPNIRPLSEAVIGNMGRPLWILLGTVGIVLLMAWTNVANLLLVRAEGRPRELAVRTALGASRSRLARELLTESLLLGLAGAACGVAFAQGGIALLRGMAPAALPRVEEIGIDAVVLFATLTTSVITSLVFGAIPILRVRAFNVDALKDGGRSMSDAPGTHRIRHALVVAQIALALVLLVVSGLMARTFVAMRQVNPGFVRPSEVQTFDVTLRIAVVREPEQVARTFEQITDGLQQVPGVQSVGLGLVSMNGIAGFAPLYVEGQATPDLPPIRWFRLNGPGYFETMGNPILAGRAFTWDDMFDERPITVISENLAREYWGAPVQAIGKRISMFANGPWDEIVGVVGNEHVDGLNRPPPSLVYSPMGGVRNLSFVVRSTRVGTPDFVRALQQAVWSVNPNVPLSNMRTLDEVQADSMAQTSFAMVMLALAGIVALVLGVVGIYGVIRYIAAQKTREIGIRMALGAEVRDVRRLFLQRGLALTMAGIALGIGAALLLTRVMTTLLFGVSPMDPITYLAASLSLIAVAVLATYLPARRASAIDPVIALRAD